MKSNVRNFIDNLLEEIADDLGVKLPDDFVYDINQPKKIEHGDVSCNVAFRIAKLAKTNPVDAAQKTRDLLMSKIAESNAGIKNIEVAGPGFLNFFIEAHSISLSLKQIWEEGDKFGQTQLGSGKSVVLEYVSANPTGPLTIAHGRQAVVGDALANLLYATGHKVHREYYLNDRGVQIQILGLSTYIRYLELLGVDKEFPEQGYQGAYVKDIAQEVLDKEGDRFKVLEEAEAIAFFSEYAASGILKGIESDLKDLKVHFDQYFSEKSLDDGDKVTEVVARLKEKGHAYEKDGATWFRSTDYGDDKDRVLIKSTGDYTYLTPDIAYHEEKFKRGFNMLINFWGPDHHGYVARLRAACEALGHEANQLVVLLVQLTTLYRKGEPVRMSTRAGEFVSLRELMDEVGSDATRFFFLMRKIESHLDFDLELAKEKSQENPVYYVQYAHARISSLLRTSEVQPSEGCDLSLIQEEKELDVVKHLLNFPEILNQSSEHLEPYRLVDYLRDLATKFHKFYSVHRVIGDDEKLTQSRLYLIKCCQIVLQNGLHLLGVHAPDKM